MTSLPKITIITIVRNGAAFIETCIRSVVQQDYPNLEYILLDGASTDGTQDIIEKYRPHFAYYHSKPDKGAYDATLQAFALISGDIVGFVMADDWLSDGALATIARLYQHKPEADIFCFGMQEHQLQKDGTKTPGRCYCDPESTHFTLFDGMYCQGINRFYSARILRQEGFFRQSLYPNLADRDLYMRLGLRNLSKAWTGETLYHFLVHPGSNSTGGNAEKFSRFLDETATIAADYLKNSVSDPRQRRLLEDWYCFNLIRSVWFTTRSGKPLDAMIKALRLCTRYPLRTIRNLIHWKMPEAFRGRQADKDMR